MDLAKYAPQFGNGFGDTEWSEAQETVNHLVEIVDELQAAIQAKSERKLSSALGHHLVHATEFMAMGECALAAFAFVDPDGYRETIQGGLDAQPMPGFVKAELQRLIDDEYDFLMKYRMGETDPEAMVVSIENFLRTQ